MTSWKPSRRKIGSDAGDCLRDERRCAAANRLVPARANERTVRTAPARLRQGRTGEEQAPAPAVGGPADRHRPAVQVGDEGDGRAKLLLGAKVLLEVLALGLAPFGRRLEHLPHDLARGDELGERVRLAHLDVRRPELRLGGDREGHQLADAIGRLPKAERAQALVQVGRRGRVADPPDSAKVPALPDERAHFGDRLLDRLAEPGTLYLGEVRRRPEHEAVALRQHAPELRRPDAEHGGTLGVLGELGADHDRGLRLRVSTTALSRSLVVQPPTA